MDKRSDDIRQDIESTRASLDEKIDLLQSKATETVDQAKSAVTDTIDQAKQILDVQHQVSERPWVALGVALAAGYVLGNLGGDDSSSGSDRSFSQSGVAYDYNQHASGSSTMNQTMDTLKSKSRDFLSQFDDEIDLLKVAAMTTLTDFIRQTVREAAPAIGDQVDRLLKQRGDSGSSTTGSQSGFASADDRSFTRTSAPNASMNYETNAGKVNNDAIPQMNRYGTPPPTPSRDEQDYYTTYQPGEDARTTGGQG